METNQLEIDVIKSKLFNKNKNINIKSYFMFFIY